MKTRIVGIMFAVALLVAPAWGIQVNVIGRVTADLKAILLAEGNAV